MVIHVLLSYNIKHVKHAINITNTCINRGLWVDLHAGGLLEEIWKWKEALWVDWKVEVHGDADGDANIVRGREGGVDKLSELASD